MPLVLPLSSTPMYFNLFHAKLVFCPMKSFHTSLNIAHSGGNPSIIMSKHFYTLPKSSCPCPHISPPPPPHFHRSKPNHLYVYALNALNVQTTSICHISHTLNPKKTQIHTVLSVLQRHSTHSSGYHTTLHLLSPDNAD